MEGGKEEAWARLELLLPRVVPLGPARTGIEGHAYSRFVRVVWRYNGQVAGTLVLWNRTASNSHSKNVQLPSTVTK